MASAAVHSVVGSIFVVAPFVCGSIVFGSCFELQYLESLLVLQSEEKAICCSVGVCVPCLFHAVPWTVIVALLVILACFSSMHKDHTFTSPLESNPSS